MIFWIEKILSYFSGWISLIVWAILFPICFYWLSLFFCKSKYRIGMLQREERDHQYISILSPRYYSDFWALIAQWLPNTSSYTASCYYFQESWSQFCIFWQQWRNSVRNTIYHSIYKKQYWTSHASIEYSGAIF